MKKRGRLRSRRLEWPPPSRVAGFSTDAKRGFLRFTNAPSIGKSKRRQVRFRMQRYDAGPYPSFTRGAGEGDGGRKW